MEEKVRDSIEVGKRLRELRKHIGLKQSEFADIIKVHQSSIALFEAGKRYLKDIHVKIICHEFHSNEDWILYGEGEMIQSNSEISMSEYARVYKLSDLDREILSQFYELKQETKKENLDSFIRTIFDYKQKVR